MAEISNPKIKVDLKDNTKAGTQSVIDNMDKIEKKSSRISNVFGKAFSDVKLAIFGSGLAGVTSKIIQATKKSSDFIEQLNVLDVAFNDNTTGIRKFTSNIAETLNLDDASIIKMASSFKILANSMGYADEMGTKFSKLMTSITVDTASLFNMSLSNTQAMLQSAVQGQTKALRKQTGVSILDRDVQTTLDVLGIDAYVQNMNSAEKSLARVITMTYRLRDSQGDLARTIESPANRFRVLTEQISLLGRNIGNVLLPAIYAVLPYLNAVLIVLNKLISSLASLLGFNEKNWDFFGKKADTLSEAFDDFGTSVGGVGTAAKKTKKELSGLREFDKLNVIKTPTDTSSGGGGGGGAGSGINPNLLKAFDLMFDNYNSRLDGVKTKATKIAEAIMKALGSIDFSNLIASGKRLWEAFKPFAENVGQGLLWTFNNVLVPLGKWTIQEALPRFLDMLANGFKILNNTIVTLKPFGEWLWKSFLSPLAKWTGGVIITTLDNLNKILEEISKSKIASTISTLATSFVLLKTMLGNNVGLLGSFGIILKKTTSPLKLFGKSMSAVKGDTRDLSVVLKPQNTILGTYKTKITNVGNAIKELPSKLKNTRTELKNGIALWQENTNGVEKLATALLGVGIASTSLQVLSQNMKDAGENGFTFSNSLGAVASGLGSIAGGAMTGASALSFLGPQGAAIGAAVGGFTALVTAIESYQNASSGITAFNDNLKTAYDTLATSLENVSTSYQNAKQSMSDVYDQKVLEMESGQAYIDSLYKIVDANGKVKEGHENEAKVLVEKVNSAYGTNIELQGKILTNDGKRIKNKEELVEISKQHAEQLKKEIQFEQYLETVKAAYKARNKAKKELAKTEEKYRDLLDDAYKRFKNNKISYKEFQDEVEKLQEKQTKSANKYKGILEETEPVIKGLDDVTKTYATGTSEQLNKTIDKISNTSKMTTKDTAKAYRDGTIEINKYIDEISKKGETIASNQKIHNKAISESFSKEWEKARIELKKLDNSTANPKLKLDTSPATTSYNKFKKTVSTDFSGTMTVSIKTKNGGTFRADGGILVNGKWRDIAQYDTGGLPPVGQMFVARERGPELVGNIGGHTAVMNNNQIVSSVSSGVAQAVRSVLKGNTGGSGVYNIYLDKDHKLGTYTLEQLQGMAKSNGKPITIG